MGEVDFCSGGLKDHHGVRGRQASSVMGERQGEVGFRDMFRDTDCFVFLERPVDTRH